MRPAPLLGLPLHPILDSPKTPAPLIRQGTALFAKTGFQPQKLKECSLAHPESPRDHCWGCGSVSQDMEKPGFLF